MYLKNDDNDDNKIYGISQDPDIKHNIMILEDEYCEKCGEQYSDNLGEWCKSCLINHLKSNFKNWTSKNEKIDNVIREIQLKINKWHDIVFEWIPFNQFSDLKEIGEGGYARVYSAIWKEGPLDYDINKKEWIRKTN